MITWQPTLSLDIVPIIPHSQRRNRFNDFLFFLWHKFKRYANFFYFLNRFQRVKVKNFWILKAILEYFRVFHWISFQLEVKFYSIKLVLNLNSLFCEQKNRLALRFRSWPEPKKFQLIVSIFNQDQPAKLIIMLED